MVPQLPLTLQHCPKELPAHVALTEDAEPHFPSRLIGDAVEIGALEVLEVVVDDEICLVVELEIALGDEICFVVKLEAVVED